MRLSAACKRAMVRPFGGVISATYKHKGTFSGIKVSLFSGDRPTKEQLNELYSGAVINAGLPRLDFNVGLPVVCNCRLLGTTYIPNVEIQCTTQLNRTLRLHGNKIVPSSDGEASFLALAFGDSATTTTSALVFVFDVGLVGSGEDLELVSTSVLVGSSIYLEDISLDFSIGLPI